MTSVRRVLPLTFGWAELSKAVSIHGADPRVRLREPVIGVLAEVDGGWFLLDTGFNAPLVLDPPLARRFHGHDIHPELVSDDQDPMLAAFDRVGVSPDDVVAVAVSHLHSDHAGGLRWFAGRVPVHCQRREWDFGFADAAKAERHGIYRIDYDDPAIDWRLSDGDTALAPGLTAVPTYGHTLGHQSFVVDLPDGRGYVFAFDAADLTENIDGELPIGSFIDCTPEDTIEPIRRLKAIAAEKGYRLIPGHDPVAWPAFEAELGV